MKKFKKIALKALSAPRIDLRKNYHLARRMHQVASLSKLGNFYDVVDFKINDSENDHTIQVRVFTPNEVKLNKIIVYFHGGGWVVGNIESYTRVCHNIAEQLGVMVYSVDYRLAPEHPFPAGLHDCFQATEVICQYLVKEHLVDYHDIVLMGDSAGANLAAVVNLMRYEQHFPTLGEQILLYPATYWTHIKERSPFPSVRLNGEGYGLTSKKMEAYMDLYANNINDRQSKYVAPLLAENLEGQPPTLIISAEYDLLRDEGEEYARRLAKSGNEASFVRIKDEAHGFISLPVSTESVQQALQAIEEFLRRGEALCEIDLGSN